MQIVPQPRPVPPPPVYEVRHAQPAENRLHPSTQEWRADRQFVALLNAYRGSGGLARERDVAEQFRRRRGPDAATLERWIADREVIAFEWQSHAWLPHFQFGRVDMKPLPEVRQVLVELSAIYDPWELADWFVRPNSTLCTCTPVEMIGFDLPAVLHAARADRFIAWG